ncbi:double-strand break repair helicase AddA [uncultured Rhodoblastus sp.]|uniref:double-strand break repair helicase AddA n=1 Tax=uncultured Rhodoblastus sp. TaxID=543037 RepID=UPI0025FC09A1|nr:double-strand break repair helicase AddA [uncultured Rhodoblastus sp.]
MKAPKIPSSTLALQAMASDPDLSAWVSANAGSGKTHVLAQRVVRLLLADFAPGRILCLTFTKAAAANMAERVFKTLGEWTSLDDERLASAIEATGARRPDEKSQLDSARKLFARAVETPGGLKIQTLHAFCESVLHAAPFEANVAAGFSIVEEVEQAQLIARARQDVLARARHDGKMAAALERIAEDAGLVFAKLLEEALRQRPMFRAAASSDADRALRLTLGLGPDDTPETVLRDTLEGGLAPARWPDLASVLVGGTSTDAKKAVLFSQAYADWLGKNFDEALDKITAIFFTQQGEPAKTLLNKKLAESHPGLLRELEDEQVRLIRMREKMKAAETAERTLSLSLIVNAILDRYERLKAERQYLDFDDLIAFTQRLLDRSSAQWVLKKLDAGIDHILVDEAQDTSAAQWKILTRICEDFFAGAGQSRANRSFFAVGDEKQSIFSFQGAAPDLFARMKGDFQRRATHAGKRFEPVELTLSFRSAPGVLAAVDKVFSYPENYRGLSAQADHVNTVHEALKRDAPSRVEIWDVLARAEQEEPRDWKLPLDYSDEADPPVASARRIAETIRRWLEPGSGETVLAEGKRRPVRPGDIMILVRRRDAFFEAMIRALKEKNVPVAGADRLKLAEHIAVMDLVAIGRAALMPADDLNLATVLKTPLFGFDDDDLIAIAPRRAGSLHEAMLASGDLKVQAACARLDLLRDMGRALPPFAFFARLLGPRGGRRAFLARLGPEAGDALDEFLNLALAHERERAPSLGAFLAEVEALDVSIKRDMDLSERYVRVMTVHAAKGLEAKIVFLPDTCAAPGGHHDGKLFAATALDGRIFPLWSPNRASDCAVVARAREGRREAAAQEYRRLLYVAMTRAEERLYIAGHRGKKELSPESWRAMIATALANESFVAPAPWGGDDKVLRFGPEFLPQPPDPAVAPAPAGAPPAPPSWLFAPAPAEVSAAPPLRPSGALDGAEEDFAEGGAMAATRLRALEEGRQLHRLFQFVPALAPALRRDAVLRDLAAQKIEPDRAALLATQVFRVLDDPRLAPLFGENAVAEARIAARLQKPGGGFVEIAGAIDRLAEQGDAVWLADFKTGAAQSTPPAQSAAHVAQMALYRAAAALLYPGRNIRCFLVYTSGPRVEEIDAVKLDAALVEALAKAPARNMA